MHRILESVEPLLSFARAQLRQSGVDAPFPGKAAVRLAEQCLRLYCAPAYDELDLGALVRDTLAFLADDAHELRIAPTSAIMGDADLMGACLEFVVPAIRLESESILVIDVFEQDGVPCVGLGLEGPGRVPVVFRPMGVVSIPMEEMNERWTLATRGGRIDPAPNGLLFRARGVRRLPEVTDECEAALGTVADALRHWGEPKRAVTLLERALERIDGARPAEPAAVRPLVEGVIGEARPRLEASGILIETLFADEPPPLPLRREPMRLFVAHVCRLAESTMEQGGAMVFMFEYNRPGAALDLAISLSNASHDPAAALFGASMRRVIVEGHEGEFDMAFDRSGITITASLPDVVGRRVREWIPGCEGFSERSMQMLRLLKSGGQVPPEALLLAGVLEEELERWLLPRLAEPAAVNIAHDLKPDNASLRGSSKERLEKALGQIGRGKPRKEIAKPPYAAEILHAFRKDERTRAAIGAERLDDQALRALCEGLLADPPPYVDCLRLIARARGG